MTATNARHSRLYASGFDLTAWARSFDAEAEVAEIDVTTIPDASKNVIGGLGDAGMSLDGLYNTATGMSKEAMAELFDADGAVFCSMASDSFGSIAQCLAGTLTKRNITVGVGEAIGAKAEIKSATGDDLARILKPKAAVTATGNGSAYDSGASSTDGGVAYLQTFGLEGTTPGATVVVQHSTDGVTWADLCTFDAVATARTGQRLPVAGTINRYVRARWTLDAGTTSLTLWVALARA